jgi:hypothetical protein
MTRAPAALAAIAMLALAGCAKTTHVAKRERACTPQEEAIFRKQHPHLDVLGIICLTYEPHRSGMVR